MVFSGNIRVLFFQFVHKKGNRPESFHFVWYASIWGLICNSSFFIVFQYIEVLSSALFWNMAIFRYSYYFLFKLQSYHHIYFFNLFLPLLNYLFNMLFYSSQLGFQSGSYPSLACRNPVSSGSREARRTVWNQSRCICLYYNQKLDPEPYGRNT